MGADLAAMVAARAPGPDAEPEARLRVAEELGLAFADELARVRDPEEPTDPLPLRSDVSSSARDRAAAIERALVWARTSGATWDGIEPVIDEGGNASMRASRALSPGETIVVLPRRLVIVDRTPGLSPRDAIATWLALEIRRSESRWAPYLATLPVHLAELPMFHVIDALAGTTAFALVTEDRRDVRRSYEALPTELRGRLSLADFAWGCAIAQSRGFHAPGSVEHRIALLPVVDLFDHQLGDTTWTFDPSDGTFSITTERAFLAGEPVGFPYGDHSNTQLYVHYGFTGPANTASEAGLVFERAADPVTAVAAHLLCDAPLDAPARVRVGLALDHRFVRALSLARLLACGPTDRALLAAEGLAAYGDVPWLGVDLEARAFVAIERAAQCGLEALDAAVRAPVPLAIERVRDAERAVLEGVLAFARIVSEQVGVPDPARVRAAADTLAAETRGVDRLVRPYLHALAESLG